MKQKGGYYVVKEKALPEVLRKVVEAKRLLESREDISVLEATEQTGISRSSFYKYKDDIFPFYDNTKGQTVVTILIRMDDAPGRLSETLRVIASYKANILTIHQSIPVGNIAISTVSMEIGEETEDISLMIDEIEKLPFVRAVKIVAKESEHASLAHE